MSRKLPEILSWLVVVFLLCNLPIVMALECPDCGLNTFNGQNCSNPHCIRNKDCTTDVEINNPGESLASNLLSNNPLEHSGAVDMPNFPANPSSPEPLDGLIISMSVLCQYYRALTVPEWIQAQYQLSLNEEGALLNLDNLFHRARLTNSGFSRAVRPEDMDWYDFLTWLLKQNNNRLFIQLGSHIQNLNIPTYFCIEMNEKGQIFVFSDSGEKWEQITAVCHPSKIIKFLLSDFNHESDSMKILVSSPEQREPEKKQAWCSDIDGQDGSEGSPVTE